MARHSHLSPETMLAAVETSASGTGVDWGADPQPSSGPVTETVQLPEVIQLPELVDVDGSFDVSQVTPEQAFHYQISLEHDLY